MKTVLVTGVNGFVGGHLVDELLGREVNVIGAGREEVLPVLTNKLNAYYKVDLTDEKSVQQIDLTNVCAVINLAGLSSVGDSFKHPDIYRSVNVGVLTVLSERILTEQLPIRMIAISSGAVYDPNQPLPLHEASNTIVNSPYAESKLLMEAAAKKLRVRGLDCIVARPFNHIGPGQGRGFILPDLYEKITSSTNGTITVGNLKSRRDYTDVRDIVKAYCDLALAETVSEPLFNLCSGVSRSGEELLALLQNKLGATDITVEVDQSLVRPTDPQELYGDSSLLRQAVGWTPTIPFEQTVEDFINWKRQQHD